jgi:hypothetical protein
MDSVADNPYQTPSAPVGSEQILAEAKDIKAGIRRDRRSKNAWYGLAIFSFVLIPVFACGCMAPTWWEGVKRNPTPTALFAVALLGLFGGFHKSLRISRSRRELNELADRYESGFPS